MAPRKVAPVMTEAQPTRAGATEARATTMMPPSPELESTERSARGTVQRRDMCRRGRVSGNLLMGLTLCTSLAACALTLWNPNPGTSLASPPKDVMPRGPLNPTELATIDLFKRASPSVVHIHTPQGVDLRRRVRVPEGSGTGWVWDDQGHIVTNFHVVQGRREVSVVFADNSSHEAVVVGSAPTRDIAVIRLKDGDRELAPLPLGGSSDLQVGQQVYAIGNPFGYDQTLTDGIISALGREITSLSQTQIWDVIQTDAAINPGNSGGPLLDSAGRVIGMNTAIFSPTGASTGIGFAIPSDSLLRVVPDLIADGVFNRPVFGFRPADRGVSERLGVKGVLVVDVQEGTPAAKAGFRPTIVYRDGVRLGDVIVAVNDERITDRVDLDRLMDQYRPGEQVKVTLLYDGKERTVSVDLLSNHSL